MFKVLLEDKMNLSLDFFFSFFANVYENMNFIIILMLNVIKKLIVITDIYFTSYFDTSRNIKKKRDIIL